MRDIYDPPPAPVPMEPPTPERLAITTSDVAWLLGPIGGLAIAAVAAWHIDLVIGLWVAIGGSFVIFESWFSGLAFLRRHPAARPMKRWLVFLAALVPWLIGLGFAAALMLGLFFLSDWRSIAASRP